ncbi:hypothetical protein [Amycolatopsis nigrescens]|uniref:hypothetical protein n=1 Tax=Amycolatopsis nigrescens TaxID=381445 RepID=UPI00036D6F91|nr:hypothetical protein [Amycolatopsis nigrescens]
MTTPEPLPYEVTHHPSYNRVAAKEAEVRILPDEQDPEEIIIEGPCVRCRHAAAFREPIVSYRDANWAPIRDRLFDKAMRAAAATGGPSKREVTVYCCCRSHHPGAPRGEGCGAYWTLNVEWGNPDG